MTHPEALTMREMFSNPDMYVGLSEQLSGMPCPTAFGYNEKAFDLPAQMKYLPVPDDLDKFSGSLCYGQKYFMCTPERHDLNVIVRYVGGYFFTQATDNPWSESECLKWSEKVLPGLRVVDLYPISTRLITLMGELAERERKLLHREPSKQERQAGIERLDKFADLAAILFLQESFRCSEDEVMQKPYNECLVRFLYHHEQAMFGERLAEVYRQEQESKSKNKYK